MNVSHGNNRAAWLQGPPAACSVPSATASTWRLTLLGAPGIGKGTQALLLSQRLGACHLSTGDVFRAAGSRPDCDQSPAMRAAQEHMRCGELVPDVTVWELVRERVGCLRCHGGFILDGFPRTLSQAKSLTGLMREENLALSAAVNYELPLDVVVARLSGRRTCKQCRAVFHIVTQPSTKGHFCDRCGGLLTQREDDRPESITVRMDAYRRATAPLIEYYSNLRLLVPIQATGTPEEIFDRTLAALEARRQADVAV